MEGFHCPWTADRVLRPREQYLYEHAPHVLGNGCTMRSQKGGEGEVGIRKGERSYLFRSDESPANRLIVMDRWDFRSFAICSRTSRISDNHCCRMYGMGVDSNLPGVPLHIPNQRSLHPPQVSTTSNPNTIQYR